MLQVVADRRPDDAFNGLLVRELEQILALAASGETDVDASLMPPR